MTIIFYRWNSLISWHYGLISIYESIGETNRLFLTANLIIIVIIPLFYLCKKKLKQKIVIFPKNIMQHFFIPTYLKVDGKQIIGQLQNTIMKSMSVLKKILENSSPKPNNI